MAENKPLILVSNDDGYHSRGLRTLVGFLSDMARVVVCAPESGRSGFSCAFSATLPLRLKRRKNIPDAEVWSCNGTPVDCVKLALARILTDRRPDIIISGINHGDNASVNTHYSGTMGVATEGSLKYIPSVAFSSCNYDEDANLEPLRPYVRRIVGSVLREGLPRGVCLNVNFPAQDSFRGVRVCRMGWGSWINETVLEHHPRGYDYYWMVGNYRNDEPEATDTDRWALEHGYVSVVPTTADVTARSAMELTERLVNPTNPDQA